MNSKSPNNSAKIKDDGNKVKEFLKYYKCAGENNLNVKEGRISGNVNDTGDSHDAVKRRRAQNKVAKKKFQGQTMNLSKIDINGPNLVSITDKLSPLKDSRVTSTPIYKNLNIKPIIKDTSIFENDISNISQKKPKKRNKSVSFMLEDNDEVTIKKTKSDDALITSNQDVVKNKLKKKKKNQIKVKEDKENNEKCISDANIDMISNESGKNKRKHSGKKATNLSQQNVSGLDHEMAGGDATTTPNAATTKVGSDKNIKQSHTAKTHQESEVKKRKRVKKQRSQDLNENESTESLKSLNTEKTVVKTANEAPKKKKKRVKKVKLQEKIENESSDTQKDFNAETKSENTNDGQKKRRKRIKKPKEKSTETQKVIGKSKKSEIETSDSSVMDKTSNKTDIAEGIENLNIGDNAHTLTNLLNGISVNKSIKKKKANKNSKANTEISSSTVSEESSKGKSKKRNSKKKRNLNAVVLVQNLPFSILLNYRQVLREHFSKFGNVHSIGIADLKCDKGEPKPIFTTRIFFQTEDAAASALTEDKSLFEGNIIRVKKYESPVARTYKPGAWVKKQFRPHKINTSEDKEENSEKDFCEKFDHDSDSV